MDKRIYKINVGELKYYTIYKQLVNTVFINIKHLVYK